MGRLSDRAARWPCAQVAGDGMLREGRVGCSGGSKHDRASTRRRSAARRAASRRRVSGIRSWNTCHVEPSAPGLEAHGHVAQQRAQVLDRAAAAGEHGLEAIEHGQRPCGVQFGHLRVDAGDRAGALAPVDAEVHEAVGSAGDLGVAGDQQPALADRERLGHVEGEDVGRPVGADQPAMLVAGAERRGRVDDERDARRVTRCQPRLADGQRGRGAERGGGQHPGHPVALLGQYPRELGRVELPRRGIDIDEQGRKPAHAIAHAVAVKVKDGTMTCRRPATGSPRAARRATMRPTVQLATGRHDTSASR